MIGLPPGTKVFLACQPIDLRAGFDQQGRKGVRALGLHMVDHDAHGHVSRLKKKLVRDLIEVDIVDRDVDAFLGRLDEFRELGQLHQAHRT